MRLLPILLLLLLATAAQAETSRILFDQGHRQAFLIEKTGPLQLSALAETLREQGLEVASSNQELTADRLSAMQGLIISGPFHPLSPAEIAAIIKFVEQGGRLALMLHINPPLLPLLHKLGVDAGNLVINERQNQLGGKSIDFFVTDLTPHLLTQGIEQFAVYGGWPLKSFAPAAESIARCSPHSWVDLNRDRQFSKGDLMSPFSVLMSGQLGRGSFAVFADDAIFQNQFLTGGNLELAKNLGKWFKAANPIGEEI